MAAVAGWEAPGVGGGRQPLTPGRASGPMRHRPPGWTRAFPRTDPRDGGECIPDPTGGTWGRSVGPCIDPRRGGPRGRRGARGKLAPLSGAGGYR